MKRARPTLEYEKVLCLAINIVNWFSDQAAIETAFNVTVYKRLECIIYETLIAHGSSISFFPNDILELQTRLQDYPGNQYKVFSEIIDILESQGLSRGSTISAVNPTGTECAQYSNSCNSVPPLWNSTAKKVCVLYNDGYLSTTLDFSQTYPTWVTSQLVAVGNGLITSIAPDYSSPLYSVGSGALNVWAILYRPPGASPTTTRIIHISDVAGSPAITTVFEVNFRIFCLASSPYEPGRACAIGTYSVSGPQGSYGVNKSIRTDDGVNWIATDITDNVGVQSNFHTLSGNIPISAAYSPLDGTLYSAFSVRPQQNVPPGFREFPNGIHRSFNNGATFEQFPYIPIADGDGNNLHATISPQGNATDLTYNVSKSSPTIYRNSQNITPSPAIQTSQEYSLSVSQTSPNVIVVAQSPSPSTGSRGLTSIDGGLNWTNLNQFQNSQLTNCLIAGDNAQQSLWWGRTKQGISEIRLCSGNVLSQFNKTDHRQAAPKLILRLE